MQIRLRCELRNEFQETLNHVEDFRLAHVLGAFKAKIGFNGLHQSGKLGSSRHRLPDGVTQAAHCASSNVSFPHLVATIAPEAPSEQFSSQKCRSALLEAALPDDGQVALEIVWKFGNQLCGEFFFSHQVRVDVAAQAFQSLSLLAFAASMDRWKYCSA